MKDHNYKEFLDELKLSYTNETFSAPFDTEVLWFPENRSLFIRGTDSWIDLLFGFMCWPNWQGFHFGFARKARELVFELEKRHIRPQTVVGHSGGGAIAQHVGWFYSCETYSLASPKTSNGKNLDFNGWAADNLVIIIQEHDIVSKLPPIILDHPVEPLVLDTVDYFMFPHSLLYFE